MFTLDDIRQIAVQIERNGAETYRRAGKRISDRELAGILDWMADEELRHARWFERMATEPKVDPAHQEVEQMGRELLQEMMKSQTFSLEETKLADAQNIVAILAESLSFEKDTIIFYEMLKSFIDDSDVLQILDRIIAEERGHVSQIERMQEGFS